MTLLELCEPLFQYVARLNRSARKGVAVTQETARQELLTILQQTKSRAGESVELADQYEKIESVLLYFVDSMVMSSTLPFALEWQPLAAEMKNEMAGDQRFFDELEQTLQENTAAAKERLMVFYVCLGVGFTGWYTGDPQSLRHMQERIVARIGDRLEPDITAKICPDAYSHVDTRNLTRTVGGKVGGVVVALVGMTLVLFVTNIYLYRTSSNELRDAVQTIIDHRPAAEDPAAEDGDSADR